MIVASPILSHNPDQSLTSYDNGTNNNPKPNIIAYDDLRVQPCREIVIILVQGAAISQNSSVHCAVLFKVIPITLLLLISHLFVYFTPVCRSRTNEQ